MSVTVGELSLVTSIDFSKFDQQLRLINNKVQKLQSTSLTVKTDLSHLHALNDLLDIKRRHLGDTIAFYSRNPLTPKGDSGAVAELEEDISRQKKTIQNTQSFFEINKLTPKTETTNLKRLTQEIDGQTNALKTNQQIFDNNPLKAYSDTEQLEMLSENLKQQVEQLKSTISKFNSDKITPQIDTEQLEILTEDLWEQTKTLKANQQVFDNNPLTPSANIKKLELLSQKLKQQVKQIKTTNKTFNTQTITPQIDVDNLEDLTEDLWEQTEALDSVQRKFQSNPLTASSDTTELELLKKELEQQIEILKKTVATFASQEISPKVNTTELIELSDQLRVLRANIEETKKFIEEQVIQVNVEVNRQNKTKADEITEEVAKAVGSSSVTNMTTIAGVLGEALSGIASQQTLAKIEKHTRSSASSLLRMQFFKFLSTVYPKVAKAGAEYIKDKKQTILETESVAKAKKQSEDIKNIKVNKNKDQVILVSAGFVGSGGQGSKGIAKELRQINKNSLIIPVANVATDVNTNAEEDPIKAVNEIAAKMVELHITKGFNQDAIDMAAKAMAIRKENPDIPIQLLGHSAGGMVVEEAIAILKQAGITNVRAVGMGAAQLETLESKNETLQIAKSKDIITFLNNIIREVLPKELLQSKTKVVPRKTHRGVNPIEAHSTPEYFSDEVVQKIINEPKGKKQKTKKDNSDQTNLSSTSNQRHRTINQGLRNSIVELTKAIEKLSNSFKQGNFYVSQVPNNNIQPTSIDLTPSQNITTILEETDLEKAQNIINRLQTDFEQVANSLSNMDDINFDIDSVSFDEIKNKKQIINQIKNELENSLNTLVEDSAKESIDNFTKQLNPVETQAKSLMVKKAINEAKKINQRFVESYGSFKDAIKAKDVEKAKYIAQGISNSTPRAIKQLNTLLEILNSADISTRFGSDISNQISGYKGSITKYANSKSGKQNSLIGKQLKSKIDFSNEDINTLLTPEIESPQVEYVGDEIIKGIVKGIEDSLNELELISKEIANIPIETATKALKIKSPSRVFIAIGQNIIKGLFVGLNNTFSFKKIKNIFEKIKDFAEKTWKWETKITPIFSLDSAQRQQSKEKRIYALDENNVNINDKSFITTIKKLFYSLKNKLNKPTNNTKDKSNSSINLKNLAQEKIDIESLLQKRKEKLYSPEGLLFLYKKAQSLNSTAYESLAAKKDSEKSIFEKDEQERLGDVLHDLTLKFIDLTQTFPHIKTHESSQKFIKELQDLTSQILLTATVQKKQTQESIANIQKEKTAKLAEIKKLEKSNEIINKNLNKQLFSGWKTFLNWFNLKPTKKDREKEIEKGKENKNQIKNLFTEVKDLDQELEKLNNTVTELDNVMQAVTVDDKGLMQEFFHSEYIPLKPPTILDRLTEQELKERERELNKQLNDLFNEQAGVIPGSFGVQQPEFPSLLEIEEQTKTFGENVADAFEMLDEILPGSHEKLQKVGQTLLFLKDRFIQLFLGVHILDTLIDRFKNFATEAVRLGAKLEGLEASFEFVYNTKGAYQIDKINKISIDWGINTETLRKNYLDLGASLKNTEMSSTIFDIMSGVAKYSVLLGATKDEQDRVFKALTQMASKGKVSLEELSGQLGEQLPGALSIGAEAMNMTTSEFIKTVSLGNISSKEFLPKFGVTLNTKSAQEFENSLDNYNVLAGRLQNKLFLIGENFGKTLLPAAKILLKLFDAFIVLTTNAYVQMALLGISANIVVKNVTLLVDKITMLPVVGNLITKVILGLEQGVLLAIRNIGAAFLSLALSAALWGTAIFISVKVLSSLFGGVSEGVKSIDKATKKSEQRINELNESLDKLDDRKIKIKFETSDSFYNIIDKLLNFIPGVDMPLMDKKWFNLKTHADVENLQYIERFTDYLTISRTEFDLTSQKVFDTKQLDDFAGKYKSMQKEIKNNAFIIEGLQLVSTNDKKEINNIEKQIAELTEKNKDLAKESEQLFTDFIPGGIGKAKEKLTELKDELDFAKELKKSGAEGLEPVISGLQTEINAWENLITLIESKIDITSFLNVQNQLIRINALFDELGQEITINISLAKVNLIDKEIKRIIGITQSQFEQALVSQQEAYVRLTIQQNKQGQLKNLLDQIPIDTQTAIQTAINEIGKPLEKITLPDIEILLQGQGIQQAPEQIQQTLELMRQIKQSNVDVATAQEQFISAQLQAMQSEIALRTYNLSLMQLEIDRYKENSLQLNTIKASLEKIKALTNGGNMTLVDMETAKANVEALKKTIADRKVFIQDLLSGKVTGLKNEKTIGQVGIDIVSSVNNTTRAIFSNTQQIVDAINNNSNKPSSVSNDNSKPTNLTQKPAEPKNNDSKTKEKIAVKTAQNEALALINKMKSGNYNGININPYSDANWARVQNTYREALQREFKESGLNLPSDIPDFPNYPISSVKQEKTTPLINLLSERPTNIPSTESLWAESKLKERQKSPITTTKNDIAKNIVDANKPVVNATNQSATKIVAAINKTATPKVTQPKLDNKKYSDFSKLDKWNVSAKPVTQPKVTQPKLDNKKYSDFSKLDKWNVPTQPVTQPKVNEPLRNYPYTYKVSQPKVNNWKESLDQKSYKVITQPKVTQPKVNEPLRNYPYTYKVPQLKVNEPLRNYPYTYKVTQPKVNEPLRNYPYTYKVPQLKVNEPLRNYPYTYKVPQPKVNEPLRNYPYTYKVTQPKVNEPLKSYPYTYKVPQLKVNEPLRNYPYTYKVPQPKVNEPLKSYPYTYKVPQPKVNEPLKSYPYTYNVPQPKVNEPNNSVERIVSAINRSYTSDNPQPKINTWSDKPTFSKNKAFQSKKEKKQYDLIVYGDEVAGILTAVQSARLMKKDGITPKIAVISEGKNNELIGGHTTRGKLGYLDRSQVPGLSAGVQIYEEFLKKAGVAKNAIALNSTSADKALRALLKEENINLIFDSEIKKVKKTKEGKIKELEFKNQKVQAKTFIDSTVGANLARKAGTNVTTGYESIGLKDSELALGLIVNTKGITPKDVIKKGQELTKRFLNPNDKEAQKWLNIATKNDLNLKQKYIKELEKNNRIIGIGAKDEFTVVSPIFGLTYAGMNNRKYQIGSKDTAPDLDKSNSAIFKDGTISWNALLFYTTGKEAKRLATEQKSKAQPEHLKEGKNLGEFYKTLFGDHVKYDVADTLYIRHAGNVTNVKKPMSAKDMYLGGVPNDESVVSFRYHLDSRGGIDKFNFSNHKPVYYKAGIEHTQIKDIPNLAVIGPASGYDDIASTAGRIVEQSVGIGQGVAAAIAIANKKNLNLYDVSGKEARAKLLNEKIITKANTTNYEIDTESAKLSTSYINKAQLIAKSEKQQFLIDATNKSTNKIVATLYELISIFKSPTQEKYTSYAINTKTIKQKWSNNTQSKVNEPLKSYPYTYKVSQPKVNEPNNSVERIVSAINRSNISDNSQLTVQSNQKNKQTALFKESQLFKTAIFEPKNLKISLSKGWNQDDKAFKDSNSLLYTSGPMFDLWTGDVGQKYNIIADIIQDGKLIQKSPNRQAAKERAYISINKKGKPEFGFGDVSKINRDEIDTFIGGLHSLYNDEVSTPKEYKGGYHSSWKQKAKFEIPRPRVVIGKNKQDQIIVLRTKKDMTPKEVEKYARQMGLTAAYLPDHGTKARFIQPFKQKDSMQGHGNTPYLLKWEERNPVKLKGQSFNENWENLVTALVGKQSKIPQLQVDSSYKLREGGYDKDTNTIFISDYLNNKIKNSPQSLDGDDIELLAHELRHFVQFTNKGLKLDTNYGSFNAETQMMLNGYADLSVEQWRDMYTKSSGVSPNQGQLKDIKNKELDAYKYAYLKEQEFLKDPNFVFKSMTSDSFLSNSSTTRSQITDGKKDLSVSALIKKQIKDTLGAQALKDVLDGKILGQGDLNKLLAVDNLAPETRAVVENLQKLNEEKQRELEDQINLITAYNNLLTYQLKLINTEITRQKENANQLNQLKTIKEKQSIYTLGGDELKVDLSNLKQELQIELQAKNSAVINSQKLINQSPNKYDPQNTGFFKQIRNTLGERVLQSVMRQGVAGLLPGDATKLGQIENALPQTQALVEQAQIYNQSNLAAEQKKLEIIQKELELIKRKYAIELSILKAIKTNFEYLTNNKTNLAQIELNKRFINGKGTERQLTLAQNNLETKNLEDKFKSLQKVLDLSIKGMSKFPESSLKQIEKAIGKSLKPITTNTQTTLADTTLGTGDIELARQKLEPFLATNPALQATLDGLDQVLQTKSEFLSTYKDWTDREVQRVRELSANTLLSDLLSWQKSFYESLRTLRNTVIQMRYTLENLKLDIDSTKLESNLFDSIKPGSSNKARDVLAQFNQREQELLNFKKQENDIKSKEETLFTQEHDIQTAEQLLDLAQKYNVQVSPMYNQGLYATDEEQTRAIEKQYLEKARQEGREPNPEELNAILQQYEKHRQLWKAQAAIAVSSNDPRQLLQFLTTPGWQKNFSLESLNELGLIDIDAINEKIKLGKENERQLREDIQLQKQQLAENRKLSQKKYIDSLARFNIDLEKENITLQRNLEDTYLKLNEFANKDFNINLDLSGYENLIKSRQDAKNSVMSEQRSFDDFIRNTKEEADNILKVIAKTKEQINKTKDPLEKQEHIKTLNLFNQKLLLLKTILGNDLSGATSDFAKSMQNMLNLMAQQEPLKVTVRGLRELHIALLDNYKANQDLLFSKQSEYAFSDITKELVSIQQAQIEFDFKFNTPNFKQEITEKVQSAVESIQKILSNPDLQAALDANNGLQRENLQRLLSLYGLTPEAQQKYIDTLVSSIEAYTKAVQKRRVATVNQNLAYLQNTSFGALENLKTGLALLTSSQRKPRYEIELLNQKNKLLEIQQEYYDNQVKTQQQILTLQELYNQGLAKNQDGSLMNEQDLAKALGLLKEYPNAIRAIKLDQLAMDAKWVAKEITTMVESGFSNIFYDMFRFEETGAELRQQLKEAEDAANQDGIERDGKRVAEIKRKLDNLFLVHLGNLLKKIGANILEQIGQMASKELASIAFKGLFKVLGLLPKQSEESKKAEEFINSLYAPMMQGLENSSNVVIEQTTALASALGNLILSIDTASSSLAILSEQITSNYIPPTPSSIPVTNPVSEAVTPPIVTPKNNSVPTVSSQQAVIPSSYNNLTNKKASYVSPSTLETPKEVTIVNQGLNNPQPPATLSSTVPLQNQQYSYYPDKNISLTPPNEALLQYNNVKFPQIIGQINNRIIRLSDLMTREEEKNNNIPDLETIANRFKEELAYQNRHYDGIPIQYENRNTRALMPFTTFNRDKAEADVRFDYWNNQYINDGLRKRGTTVEGSLNPEIEKAVKELTTDTRKFNLDDIVATIYVDGLKQDFPITVADLGFTTAENLTLTEIQAQLGSIGKDITTVKGHYSLGTLDGLGHPIEPVVEFADIFIRDEKTKKILPHTELNKKKYEIAYRQAYLPNYIGEGRTHKWTENSTPADGSYIRQYHDPHQNYVGKNPLAPAILDLSTHGYPLETVDIRPNSLIMGERPKNLSSETLRVINSLNRANNFNTNIPEVPIKKELTFTAPNPLPSENNLPVPHSGNPPLTSNTKLPEPPPVPTKPAIPTENVVPTQATEAVENLTGAVFPAEDYDLKVATLRTMAISNQPLPVDLNIAELTKYLYPDLASLSNEKVEQLLRENKGVLEEMVSIAEVLLLAMGGAGKIETFNAKDGPTWNYIQGTNLGDNGEGGQTIQIGDQPDFLTRPNPYQQFEKQKAIFDDSIKRLSEPTQETQSNTQAIKDYSQQTQNNTQYMIAGLQNIAGLLGNSIASSGEGGIGGVLLGVAGSAVSSALNIGIGGLFSGGKKGTKTDKNTQANGAIGIAYDGGEVGKLNTYSDGGMVDGTVQNLANGGKVSGMNLVEAVNKAVKRERAAGGNPRLVVASKGEEILSTKKGDAQFFRMLKESGQWNQLKKGEIPTYNNGGSIGTSYISPQRNIITNNKSGNTNSVNINVYAQDANSFRKSESQIQKNMQRQLNRSRQRNG